MEWLGLLVVAFAAVGVGLAVREWRTGRGKIIDERPDDRVETEADREAMRITDTFRDDGPTTPH